MNEKDKRGANFTKTETDLLIDITSKYKNILENKRTDATTWKDKNEVAIKISNQFNATSGSFPRLKRYRLKNSVLSHLRKLSGLFFILYDFLCTNSKSSLSDSNISITSGHKFIFMFTFS